VITALIHDGRRLLPLRRLVLSYLALWHSRQNIATAIDGGFLSLSQTIDRFGAWTKASLNFKFSEEEQKAKNPRKAYIQNFAVFVANGIEFLAKPFQVFIERLKTIFNSALNNRRIFR
jgi:hypothetical protein